MDESDPLPRADISNAEARRPVYPVRQPEPVEHFPCRGPSRREPVCVGAITQPCGLSFLRCDQRGRHLALAIPPLVWPSRAIETTRSGAVSSGLAFRRLERVRF